MSQCVPVFRKNFYDSSLCHLRLLTHKVPPGLEWVSAAGAQWRDFQWGRTLRRYINLLEGPFWPSSLRLRLVGSYQSEVHAVVCELPMRSISRSSKTRVVRLPFQRNVALLRRETAFLYSPARISPILRETAPVHALVSVQKVRFPKSRGNQRASARTMALVLCVN